jgi:hypothetical protein
MHNISNGTDEQIVETSCKPNYRLCKRDNYPQLSNGKEAKKKLQ